jgi:hypothetical protein
MVDKTLLTEVVQNILAGVDKDKKELFASLCELPVLQDAKASVLAGSPERFRFSLSYHFERIMDGLLETVIPRKREAQFIFRHYQFLELNFKDIIRQYEGSCCCADKSRTVLKRLTHFYLTGNEIVFDPMDITAFSYPTTVFTTHKEIVEFFDGLHNLYYGRPELYLNALQNIKRIAQ